MATTERITPAPGRRTLVEKSWAPVTRIIGNLGIYTKIDFDNHEVVECKATSSLFRGYSVFMKGKDPRDAGFITSRIRSEEHTSELQSRLHLVCRLLLEKKQN